MIPDGKSKVTGTYQKEKYYFNYIATVCDNNDAISDVYDTGNLYEWNVELYDINEVLVKVLTVEADDYPIIEIETAIENMLYPKAVKSSIPAFIAVVASVAILLLTIFLICNFVI